MSKNQRHPKTVINDKLQGAVAPCLKRSGSFEYRFITNLLPSFLSRNFKDRSTSGKVVSKKILLISQALCAAALSS